LKADDPQFLELFYHVFDGFLRRKRAASKWWSERYMIVFATDMNAKKCLLYYQRQLTDIKAKAQIINND
jgi:hypothetical protein